MTPKQVQALELKFQKLEKRVISLEAVLRHLLPVDDEGEYKASFVREIKRASREKPVYEFTDAASFLKLLKKV